MAIYGQTLVTAPATEPITLAEAKLQCGIATDVNYHDPLLQILITAAREKVEADTSRAIITQTWDYSFDLWPIGLEAIYLPRAPVASITSVKYYDQANAQQTLSTTVYKTMLDREPGEIRVHYQQQWPFLYGEPGGITVRYVAGYGTANTSVPQSLRQALLLLIDHWFENRDTVGNVGPQISNSYETLIARHTVGDDFHSYGRSLYGLAVAGR